MLGWEAHIGEYVLLGGIHELGEFGDIRPELIGDLAPLALGRVGRFMRVGGGDERRDDTPAAIAGMGERIAGEVRAAALPDCAEHARYCRLDALMGICPTTHSPAFNPIEKAFFKLKAMLKKIGEHTVNGLWELIGRLVDIFQSREWLQLL